MPGCDTEPRAGPARQSTRATLGAAPPRGAGPMERPGRSSAPRSASIPSTTSRPGPQGSQSASNTSVGDRAATTANAAANTDAPAPPQAPRTAMHRPSPGPPMTASDSTPTRNCSDCSISTVRSTPNRTHCSHRPASGSAPATTTTPGLRESRAPTARGTRAASISTTEAERHRPRRPGSRPCETSTPAAAAIRNRSSSMTSSSVMISGRSSITTPPGLC